VEEPLGARVRSPSATGDYGDGCRFELSPDGTVRLVYYPYERRNNEWWETAAVFVIEKGGKERELFSVPHFFEARFAWVGERDLTFSAGEAFSQDSVRFAVSVDQEIATVVETGETFPLARAERAIEAAFKARYPKPSGWEPSLPSATAQVQRPARTPTTLRDVVLGLSIALAFLVLVAVVSYLWHEAYPPEPP